jgi:NodT family efflux transporter outer membrane factor (OMF) lipoprotein
MLLLCACKVGPDYTRPTVKTPDHYKEIEKEWKVAEPQDAKERGTWWSIFKNAKLNALEEKLNSKNFNIEVAEAQYKQALALVEQARAHYFPTLAGSASSLQEKESSYSGGTTQPSATVKTPNLNIYGVNVPSLNIPVYTTPTRPFYTKTLSATASWELDLWGATRRSVEANKANAEASAAQLASMRLSMQASLAQTYFQLCILDMHQKTLNSIVTTYKKVLKITKNQYAVGVASLLDVANAENQFQSTQTQANDNAINRSAYEHAIAVLIGESPADFSLPPQTMNLRFPSIPVGIPSTLLERRPDIAAAERAIAQANAQIGVAISGYFPQLTLSGTAGFQTGKFRQWFSKPYKFWSLGPQLAETLFDAGSRAAQVKAARATYQANVASYRQTVLAAFQDVEDNLATLRILKSEATAQNKVLENAERILKIVTNQYEVGSASALDVANAKTTLHNAKQLATDFAGRRLAATVGLIKALGGGWRPDT